MATAFTVAQIASAGSRVVNHDPTKKPGRGTLFFRSVRLDFDAIGSAVGAVAVNDTYQLFDVAVGDIILMAGINVITACTAAMTADIGFTGSIVDHFIDGFACNAVTMAPAVTTCLDSPVYISAADTLDLKAVAQSPAGGVIEVWALIGRI